MFDADLKQSLILLYYQSCSFLACQHTVGSEMETLKNTSRAGHWSVQVSSRMLNSLTSCGIKWLSKLIRHFPFGDTNRKQWGSPRASAQLPPQHGGAAGDGGWIRSAYCHGSALLRSDREPPVCKCSVGDNPIQVTSSSAVLWTCVSLSRSLCVPETQTGRPCRQPAVLRKCRNWFWTLCPKCAGPRLEQHEGHRSGWAAC